MFCGIFSVIQNLQIGCKLTQVTANNYKEQLIRKSSHLIIFMNNRKSLTHINDFTLKKSKEVTMAFIVL